MRTKKNTKYVGKKAKVLQIEPNTTYRKYKESAHISVIDYPISQSTLDMSPIWTPIAAAEVKRNYNSVQCRLTAKHMFLCWYHTKFVSLVIISILIVHWFYASYVWNYFNLIFVLTLAGGLCCA
jgi:hypothetical protein